MQVALCTECNWRRIQRPDYLCRWVDLKHHFRTKYKKAGNLKTCVSTAGVPADEALCGKPAHQAGPLDMKPSYKCVNA
jgi:hypothetical protein